MTKATFLLLVLLFLVFGRTAHAAVQYEGTFALGGSGGDRMSAFALAADGQVVAGGHTNSGGMLGGNGFWLSKIDVVGGTGVTFNRAFDGTASDYGRAMTATSDGGFVIAGDGSSWGQGSGDITLVKTTSTGAFSWAQAWGGAGNDVAMIVIETSASSLVVVGYTAAPSFGLTGTQPFALKASAAGAFEAMKVYDFGGNTNHMRYGSEMSDATLLMCGKARMVGQGLDDIFVMKTDSALDTIWLKTYGTTDSEAAWACVETSAGEILVAGETDSDAVTTGGGGDQGKNGLLLWLDSNGAEIRCKTYGHTGVTDAEFFKRVYVDSDDSLLIGGSTNDATWSMGNYDWLIMHLTPTGDIIWAKSDGSADDEILTDCVILSDDRYLCGGETGTSWAADGNMAGGFVVIPKNGEGSCHNEVLPGLASYEGTGTFVVADHTGSITQTDQAPIGDACAGLLDSDEVFTSTNLCAFAAVPTVTPSQSPSMTTTPSQTATQTSTPSQTASQSASQTASSTATQSSTLSSSPSSSQQNVASASASASSEIDTDACTNHECATEATCEPFLNSTYFCDCSTVTTSSKNLIATGLYCEDIVNTRASASSSNCAVCKTVFLTDVVTSEQAVAEYGSAQAYIAALPELIAMAACGCESPSEDLIARYAVVQTLENEDGSFNVEIMILPSNDPRQQDAQTLVEYITEPDASSNNGFSTYAVSTERPADLPARTSSDEEGLPYAIIFGCVAGFLALVIVGGVLRSQIKKRYAFQAANARASAFKVDADGSLVVVQNKAASHIENIKEQSRRVSTAWA